MRIILSGGVLNIPIQLDQIICRPDQVQRRIAEWEQKGYEVYEIRTIDRYTTLMRFIRDGGRVTS